MKVPLRPAAAARVAQSASAPSRPPNPPFCVVLVAKTSLTLVGVVVGIVVGVAVGSGVVVGFGVTVRVDPGTGVAQESVPGKPAAARSTLTPSVTVTAPLPSTSQAAMLPPHVLSRSAAARRTLTPSLTVMTPLSSASPQSCARALATRSTSTPATTIAPAASRAGRSSKTACRAAFIRAAASPQSDRWSTLPVRRKTIAPTGVERLSSHPSSPMDRRSPHGSEVPNDPSIRTVSMRSNRGAVAGALILGVLGLCVASHVARAEADSVDPETLRRDLVGFAAAMAQHAGSAMVASDLRDRVERLQPDELTAFADAVAAQPGWQTTLDVVRSFAISPAPGARAKVVEPGPPSARCPPPLLSTAAILNLILTREAFEITAAGLHAGCDIDVAGFNPAPLCVAAGVADAVFLTIVAVLDTNATCADEADSLAHDAAVDTQAGMASQLDSIESKLDASASAIQDIAERQLERQLQSCRPLVSLVLPRQFGGRLEDVRALVAQRLTNVQLAGVGDVPGATARLQHGDEALATRDYRGAYRNFCLAYRLMLAR